MAFIASLPRLAAVAFVRAVSSFFRALGMRGCRYSPTCSDYAADAFASRGFFAASALALGRVLRCHPFAAGGYDPVRPSER